VPSRARVHDVLRIAAALLAVVAITYQLARLQGHPSFGGVGNFSSRSRPAPWLWRASRPGAPERQDR